ncbi:MAG TPA: O-antigen ligase family protein [Longimicrobiales bacterium]|nr:O-antigen ligase family protein [Longimicrobiales bacterium]
MDDAVQTAHASPPVEPAGGRAAFAVLAMGAVLVVLAVVTWRDYELDRFYVPKELVLHATAAAAGLLSLRAFRRMAWSWIDGLLLAYVALGVVSALLAQNGWLATRALAITASSLAIFWTARVLHDAGRGRQVLAIVAVAVIAGAATSLLQTYGVRSDFFSINRAPGGTLGNRNSIAHMAAFGLPVVLLLTLTARSIFTYLLGAVGSTLVVATLVLTRSRAGWLGLAAVLVIFAGAVVVSAAVRRQALLRLLGIVALAGAGVAGAVLLPNNLRWVDDNPYLSSVRDVANYREGSGAGRLVQYRQTLKLAASSPMLGVGPGNWAVAYPEHAVRRDPSLDTREAGRTANPWPSSDWVAFAAERGFPALLLLVGALAGIALASLRTLLNAGDDDDALHAVALLATLAATVVAGLFDAVLLLALPALLVWAALGALWKPALRVTRAQRESTHVSGVSHVSGTAHVYERPPAREPLRGLPTVAAAFVLLVCLVGALRSASQLAGMGIDANVDRVAWLDRGAIIDPGNYRLRVRLARPGSGLPRERRCEHARAAADLYPSAAQARSLSRGCGTR